MDATPDRPSSEQPSEPVSLPWIEPGYREFKDIFASGAIAVLLVVAAVNLVQAVSGGTSGQLSGGLIALVLAVIAAAIWYGPTGWVGTRVTVDEQGLWVRHWGWSIGSKRLEFSIPKHLPAHQLGEAMVVTEEKRKQMWRRSMSLDYRGKLLGWTRVNVNRDTTEAVMVEQADAGLKRPWWLLKCQACPELVEAIELCRQANSNSNHDTEVTQD